MQKITREQKKIWNEKYLRSTKGFFNRVYNGQKYRSKLRGWTLPYTFDEFFDRYSQDNTFIDLYSKWSDGGYKKRDVPVWDRINNTLPYSFDNLQIITFSENSRKATREEKMVKHREVMLVYEDKVIIFPSIKFASEYLNKTYKSVETAARTNGRFNDGVFTFGGINFHKRSEKLQVHILTKIERLLK